MSLTLIIVRHGEAYSNLHDTITDDRETELTMRGKMQAMETGMILKEMKAKTKFDAVFSSPYERAKETCFIALEAAGMKGTKVEFSQLLVERNYYGLKGQSITKNVDLLQSLDDKETGDKIESYEREVYRFRHFLKEVRRRYPNGNILIFTHGLFEQAISKLCTGERPELLKNGGIRTITTN